MKSAENAHPGDEVKIEIETKNNPGIVAFRYRVNYDREHFELVSAAERDFSGINFSPLTMDPFIASWFDASSGNNTTNGVTAELTFRVREGTPDAVYPIELSYYMQGDVCNFDLQEVSFELHNGSITVGSGGETVNLPPVRDPDNTSQGDGRTPNVTLPSDRRTPSIPDSIPQLDITFSELEDRIRNNSGYDATTETGSSSSKGGKKKTDSSGVEALPDPEDALAGDDTSADDTSTEAEARNGNSNGSKSLGEAAVEEEKSRTGLIIGIIAAAVVVAAGAAVIIRRKKI